MAANGIIRTNIAKKYWMALTGLFLCIFLVAHLIGNLPLVIPHLLGQPVETIRDQYNEYTHFMTHAPAIMVVSYLVYFSIIFHALDGLWVTQKNLKARDVNYVYNKPSANTIWNSRYMGVLGTVILVFIVLHMGNFWVKYKFGELTTYRLEHGLEVRNLFDYVVVEFKALWYVTIYVLSMAAIGFHLYHGFQSAFQSMGWNHPKYTPFVKRFGYGFAIVIPTAFAIIPVYVYLFY